MLVALVVNTQAASANIKVLAPEAITNLVNSRIGAISGRVSVKDFGALGDGIANDTAAFYDALAAATITKGKVVYIPPGTYLINIVLNSAYNGLTLESDASGPGVGSSSPYLRPYNTSLPTVTVGDDVNIVTGLTLRNLIISGQNGANYSDYALKLIGAYENTFTDIAVYSGKRASLYVTSNLKPCYYNYFQRLVAFPYLSTGYSNSTAVMVEWPAGVPDAVTSLYISQSHINGGNYAGAIYNAGAEIFFDQTWVQASIQDPAHVLIELHKTATYPVMHCNQFTIDTSGNPSTIVAITNSSVPWQNAQFAIRGDYNSSGFIVGSNAPVNISAHYTAGSSDLILTNSVFSTNGMQRYFLVSGADVPITNLTSGAMIQTISTLTNATLSYYDESAVAFANSGTPGTLTVLPAVPLNKTPQGMQYIPQMYNPVLHGNLFFVDNTHTNTSKSIDGSARIYANSKSLFIDGDRSGSTIRISATNGTTINGPLIQTGSSSDLRTDGNILIDNLKGILFGDSADNKQAVLRAVNGTMYTCVATNWTGGLWFYDPQSTYTNNIYTDLNFLPKVNMTNDLGSATKSFRRIYNERYDDLPPRQLQVGSTAPATSATFRELVQTYQFSGTASNQVYLSWQMPHSWKEGSSIIPHIHYSPQTITANSNTVWLLEYTWQNMNGTFGATTSSQITNTFIPVQYSHNLAQFPAISGAGKTISSILVCRLVRRPEDGGDDYVNQVNLLDVDLHILCDTMGSLTDTAK